MLLSLLYSRWIEMWKKCDRWKRGMQKMNWGETDVFLWDMNRHEREFNRDKREMNREKRLDRDEQR